MHDPNTDQQPTVVEPTPARPFRLGIAHLMVWTACSAVLITCYRTSSLSARDVHPALVILGYLVYSITFGAALASLAVFFTRHKAGIRFPVSGGQWVLFFYGWIALGIVGMRVVYQLLCWAHEVETLDSSSALFYWFLQGLLAFTVALLFAGLALLELPARWKAFALLTAVVSFLQGCMYFALTASLFSVAMLLRNLVTFVIVMKLIPLAVCLRRDRREANRYDALHWAGWAVGFIAVLMECYWRVLQWVS